MTRKRNKTVAKGRNVARSKNQADANPAPAAPLVANPPRPNRTLLLVSIALWLAWLGVLVAIVWRG